MSYFFGDEVANHFSVFIVPCCLLSTIPLSYYAGKAVSSISAQTSILIGSILNAIYGSIVELMFNLWALYKGLHFVVQEQITGLW